MEKKTIGGFIATLRKANGMTQKELAERLNVSDKTISRWERDDGAPDLSAIPVIAEIFGVTCDELLRGERKSVMERTENVIENETTAKGERERQRILTVSLSKYKSKTFITMGISLVGLIAAMIGNFGFLRANIGFLCGSVFYLAGVICQAVFLNGAFLSVADLDLENIELGTYKRMVIKHAEYSIGLSVVLMGFSLPLMILVDDAYAGLTVGSWFRYGSVTGIVVLILVCVVCNCLNASFLNRQIYILSEKENSIYKRNRTLMGKCVAGLILAMVGTITIQAVVAGITCNNRLADKIVFTDIESFVEYMEQDVKYHRDGEVIQMELSTVIVGEDRENYEEVTDDTIYYDRFGNVISEEEVHTNAIHDLQGNVMFAYVQRNESVASISTSFEGDELKGISIITYEGLEAGRMKESLINAGFIMLYCVEIFICVIVYFKKRQRLRRL